MRPRSRNQDLKHLAVRHRPFSDKQSHRCAILIGFTCNGPPEYPRTRLETSKKTDSASKDLELSDLLV